MVATKVLPFFFAAALLATAVATHPDIQLAKNGDPKVNIINAARKCRATRSDE